MKQKQLFVLTDCRGSLNPDNRTDLDMECRENTAGANQSTALRGFSVWLSWKGAPLISVLPGFAPQGGWPPVYGPPSPLLPGPSSRCRRETRSKFQSVCFSVVFRCFKNLSLSIQELFMKSVATASTPFLHISTQGGTWCVHIPP